MTTRKRIRFNMLRFWSNQVCFGRNNALWKRGVVYGDQFLLLFIPTTNGEIMASSDKRHKYTHRHMHRYASAKDLRLKSSQAEKALH